MPFHSVLRSLRKESDLTQRELGNALGLSESTIGMYERGQREPDFETLEAIADYFNVDMNYLTGRSSIKREYTFSPETVPITREIDPIYDALNKDGQRELCRYGRYLGGQEEYQATDTAPPILQIKHYLVPAAAGYASPIEGEDYELIPLPADAPTDADFCLTIEGDSMEPYLPNGSMAYVKRDVPLQEFEVGIFFVDGDVLCKQWCKSYDGSLYLLSANPAREDANRYLSRDSGQTCICFGKVLLKRRLPRPAYR